MIQSPSSTTVLAGPANDEKALSLEHLVDSDRKLTWRDPTPEEIDAAKCILKERERRS